MLYDDVYPHLVTYLNFAARKVNRQYPSLDIEDLKQDGRVAIYRVCKLHPFKSHDETVQMAKTAIFRAMYTTANRDIKFMSDVLYGSLFDLSDRELIYDDTEEQITLNLKRLVNSIDIDHITNDILYNLVFPSNELMRLLQSSLKGKYSTLYIKRQVLREYIMNKYAIDEIEYRFRFKRLQQTILKLIKEEADYGL